MIENVQDMREKMQRREGFSTRLVDAGSTSYLVVFVPCELVGLGKGKWFIACEGRGAYLLDPKKAATGYALLRAGFAIPLATALVRIMSELKSPKWAHNWPYRVANKHENTKQQHEHCSNSTSSRPRGRITSSGSGDPATQPTREARRCHLLAARRGRPEGKGSR